MKKVLLTVLTVFLLLFSAKLSAHPDSIGVSNVGGKKFVLHRVEPSEGWYSIARHYGITYAELRMANKDSTDLLQPGMSILVPIERPKPGDPFYEKNYVDKREEVNHIVKEGETLFSIAKRYSTSVDSLKKWNNLVAFDLKVGQKLIVGYHLTNEKTPVNKTSTGAIGIPDTSKSTSKKNGAVTTGDSTNIIKTATVSRADTKKPSASVTGKGRKEITETGIAAWIRDDDINPNKYYALHRTAPIGTIIKVTNKMNGKYVFVKVVGTLPDTGDNNDLVIKISKASAEKLGVRDSRFQSELSYGITEKK